MELRSQFLEEIMRSHCIKLEILRNDDFEAFFLSLSKSPHGTHWQSDGQKFEP